MYREKGYAQMSSDEQRAKVTHDRMARTGSNKVAKVLCPTEATGSLIGSNGANMKVLEKKNGASIRVSRKEETFPGINERVIDIMGNLSALKECVNTVQCHIRSTVMKSSVPQAQMRWGEGRQNHCILLLSDDAAGQMMGRGGEGTKKLTQKWRCTIEASERKDMCWTLKERWVKVSGKPTEVEGCINDIITMSVEAGVRPMTHGASYAGLKAGPGPQSSKTQASLSKNTTQAPKPTVNANKFASLSKPASATQPNRSADNPNHHGFNTGPGKNNQPSGLTASAQNSMNPYRTAGDSKGTVKDVINKAKAGITNEDGWQTVVRKGDRKLSTGEAVESSPSPVTRLADLEGGSGEMYFDLTGYSVYQLVNLDNELPVKPVLFKDF